MGHIREAGRLEPVSLFARFDFTRAALYEAAEAWLAARQHGSAAKPREVATYVHELTHYLQYTTTPYGLFLQWCRLLQNHATINMVEAMLSSGCPITLPLLYNFPNMPPTVERLVGFYLQSWLNIESLINSLNGDSERRTFLLELNAMDFEREKQGLWPMRPPLQGLQSTFQDVQLLLAQFIEHKNACQSESGEPPIYPNGIDRTALAREAASLRQGDDVERFLDAEAFLRVGDQFGVAGIIEGTATAAEYWETGLSYDQFAGRVMDNDTQELDICRVALAWGLNAIDTRDLNEFIASYLTISELALFPPLLPQQVNLRLQDPGFRQLMPTFRFADLMSSACRTRPMLNRSDHQRYVQDLCADLKWVPHLQVVTAMFNDLRVVSDPICYIYQAAQHWRANIDTSTFIGFDSFLSDRSPFGALWRETFDFVINDFSDRTTYHKDKGFLESMTTRYLNMLGLQAIMVSDSLTLTAPYSNSADEKRWMTEWLRQRFETLFKRKFPDIQFV